MECEYCNKMLKTQSSLKQHQLTAKYCLAKQNKEPIKEYYCSACNIGFTLKYSLKKHLQICKSNTPEIHQISQELDVLKKELELSLLREKEKDLLISEQKIIIKELQEQYKSHIEMQNKDLQDRIQSMAEKAIERTWETVVEIEQETENPQESTDEPYELVPLELDNGYIIESRDSDRYIDVTNLCTAGKKKFNGLE